MPTSIWVWISSAMVVSVRPVTISGRGPTRSVRRPAIGAITTIMSVVGRKRTPASTGE